MERISTPSSVPDANGAGKAGFRDGNKAGGIKATEFDAGWCNSLQEEICNVIEGAGLEIDKDDKSQLLQALSIILSNADLAVRFTTTAAIVLNGLAVQAGGEWPGALTDGDYILVKNQAAAANNGWYVAHAGAWERVVYLNEDSEIKAGMLTKVTEGATLADSIWMLTTDNPIDVGVTALNYARKDQSFTQAQADARYVGIGYMLIRDEKPAGTDGGNAVNGLNIRTLNTVYTNTIAGASLASSQFTLPAGTYRINARAPAFDIDRHKALIYNVTDAAIALVGYTPNGVSSATSEAFVKGKVTISASKVFELRHYTGSSGSAGLGSAANLNGMVEIYGEVEIIKES